MQASLTRPGFILPCSFKRTKQKTPDSAKQAPIEGYIAGCESGQPAAGKKQDTNIQTLLSVIIVITR
jgi:hypothetical protein